MKLNKVPYLPTEADLSSLPRVVCAAIVNYNRAFSYWAKFEKMLKFYRATNGTGMKQEDADAMRKAIVNKNRAQSEMFAAYTEKENVIREFEADPQSFWDAQQLSDEDQVVDGFHYVDICAELRAGM